MATKRYRTGPTSYINLNDEDYKKWIAAGNVEYGAEPEAAPEPEAADEPDEKAAEKPAENKARKGPPQKKAQ